MILREKLNKIKASEIYKLEYNGSPIGLRIKIYNVDLDQYNYYDFALSVVKHESIKKKINELQSEMTTLQMVDCEGGYATTEELSGVVTVKEFKSEEQIVEVLKQIVYVYECRKAES